VLLLRFDVYVSRTGKGEVFSWSSEINTGKGDRSVVADTFPVFWHHSCLAISAIGKRPTLPRGKTMYLPTSLQRMLFWLFDKLHIA
jgi:hypothetical protein